MKYFILNQQMLKKLSTPLLFLQISPIFLCFHEQFCSIIQWSSSFFGKFLCKFQERGNILEKSAPLRGIWQKSNSIQNKILRFNWNDQKRAKIVGILLSRHIMYFQCKSFYFQPKPLYLRWKKLAHLN